MKKLSASLLTLVLGLGVSAAWACPKDKEAADGKGGCGKSATTVAAKVEDGRSDTADGAKQHAPCSKSAETVADKAPCAKSGATTVADKAPCSKSATTTADKAPCGTSATTVADKKPCGSGCGDGCPCSALKKATAMITGPPEAKTVADRKPCGSGCGDGCPCSALAKAGGKAPCGGEAKTVAENKGGCDKPCHGKASLTKDGHEGCPIGAKVKAVLASLPSMQYRVGDETVGCSETAAKLAESSGKPMQFVVGEETFSDQGAAMAKLASVLDDEMKSMQSVQFVAGGKCHKCPMTAKSVAQEKGGKVMYRVAGVDFENKEDAEKALELAAQAAEKVAMAYKVGDQTYHCDKTAGEKSKEAGAKLTYVVGDEEMCCETAAKARLAEAKIRTMVETVVASSLSM